MARIYADNRAETDSCEANTPGCSINHTAEGIDSECDTW